MKKEIKMTIPSLILNIESNANFNDYWRVRRKEISSLLQKEYLGDWPGKLNAEFKTVGSEKNLNLSKERIAVRVRGKENEAKFEFDLYGQPTLNATKPCFIWLNFEDNVDTQVLKTVTDAGYMLAVANYNNIEPDVTSDEELNVQKLINEFPGKSWGKIGAWAYGGSKIADYLFTRDDVDSNRIAVIGHSRLGLAAAWCGAMDGRIALTICNNNGAMYRGSKAESYTDLSRDYTRHWFSKNAFGGGRDENAIPFDMHFLHALIAPRYLYLAGAREDKWCDADGQLRSIKAASEVFEKLDYHNPYAGFSEKKEIKEGLTSYPYGKVGFHLREGDHDLKLIDWEEFISFRKRANI